MHIRMLYPYCASSHSDFEMLMMTILLAKTDERFTDRSTLIFVG